MKRIIYISTVLFFAWFLSCNYLQKKPTKKVMDKDTEKVLMNPNGFTPDSSSITNINDTLYFQPPLYIDSITHIIVIRPDTIFIHDTLYIFSSK